MKKLLYLGANANIPSGRTSSTARKGLKWFHKVSVGDTVELVETESGKHLGYAAIVAKEALSYTDVLANADHNHVGVGRSLAQAKEALAEALAAAYGDNKSYETFTVLHILPLQGLDETFARLVKAAQAVTDTAKTCIAEAVGEAIKSNARARTAEYAASLLMDTVAQMQDATQQRVQAIGEDIAGILSGVDVGVDATSIEPSAVERSTNVGDITMTTRVEFDPE